MSKVNLITATLITYDEVNNLPNARGKKFADQQITFKLAEDTTVTGEGRLLTPKACHQMVKDNFLANVNGAVTDFNGYRVGKEAILQIIGQVGCEGLLVLNCLNDLNEDSLVFAGVDVNGKLLKPGSFSGPEITGSQTSAENAVDIPVLIERIGFVSTKTIINEMESSNPTMPVTEKINIMTNTFLGIAE